MPSRAPDLSVASVAVAMLALGAVEARRGTLRVAEARSFARLNTVSDRIHRPVWVVMQLGSLGGTLATGGVVAALVDRRLGQRLATVGALSWLGSKAIKPFARRGRPASVVDAARVLGRAQAGLGYPSGHAAVGVAMASAAVPHLPPPWRGPAWAGAAVIGATRVYVGAHLPLDVLGGYALGIATERSVRAVMGPA